MRCRSLILSAVFAALLVLSMHPAGAEHLLNAGKSTSTSLGDDLVAYRRARHSLEHEPNLPLAVSLYREFLTQHPHSSQRADASLELLTALSRLRDWPGFFEEAERVGQELQSTSAEHASRALVESAIYRWILEADLDATLQVLAQAAREFEGTAAAHEAERWVRGLEMPESPEGLDLQWEVAVRSRTVMRDRLRSTQAHRAVVAAAEGGWLEVLLRHANPDDEQKAELLYRIAFSHFQTGHQAEAWNWAQEIITRFPGTDQARIKAPAIQALSLVRGNETEAAAEKLRTIAETLRSDDAVEAGYVYEQLARARGALGDSAGELAAWTELVERFPNNPSAVRAQQTLASAMSVSGEIR